jgi:hypothetical protein
MNKTDPAEQIIPKQAHKHMKRPLIPQLHLVS